MKFNATIREDGLIEVVDHDKLIRNFDTGPVEISIPKPDQPRSHPQNRLYWATLRWMCANLQERIESVIGHMSEKSLHETLKARAGLDSTSFATADHDLFTEYFREVQENEMPFFCGCSFCDALPEVERMQK